MKKNKSYIIIPVLVLILIFPAACDKISEVIEGSQEDRSEGVIEELEEDTIVEEAEEEEEETAELKEELSAEEKLDEVEQMYSTEFRLYLGTLDRNYMESLLEDGSLMQQ